MKRIVVKKLQFILALVLLIILFTACGNTKETISESASSSETISAVLNSVDTVVKQSQEESESNLGEETAMIKITVGDAILTAVPADNSSAEAFLALLQEQPITVQMSDYAGMEKVGALGTDLPRNDTQINVGAGDVILYQGNQITIYYGTNSWNFTKLAHIEDATKDGLLEVLGSGDVEVTFSLVQ
jgi:hypothetical protein